MRGFQPADQRDAKNNGGQSGLVHGPGTGTSDEVKDAVAPGTYIMPADSTRKVGADNLEGMGVRGFAPGRRVPVNLSNGEFKLPPEQVHAIGAQALDQLKDATHTPVRGFAPGMRPPAPPEPRFFFADGGLVEVEPRKQVSPSNIYPQGSPSAGRSPYVGSAPAAGPQARGFAPRVAGPSELYMQDRTQEMKDQVGAGNYAQAAGTAARTAVQGLGMYGIEVADKLTAPVVNGARGFGEGLFGTANAAAPPAAPPAATPMATPAAATPAIAAAPPVRGSAPGPAGESPRSVTQQAGAASGAAQAAPEVSPGVFDHGRGQYSDQSSGMGFARGFTGRPSPAANGAAESLVRGFAPGMRPEPAASTVRGFQPGAVVAPVARHSGNDWQARNDLRNAQVSASSIMNDGGRWDQHKGMSPAVATAAAMTSADLAAQGSQPGMDTEAMRQNAALTREGMQQAGETQRAGTRAAIEAQRTGIAAQQADTQRRSVDSQVEAQGYANRVAAQQEQLRRVLVDPNATPQQKAQAQQSLRALAGQGQNDWRVQVTPAVKNADGSTSEGSVLRYNQATGDVQRVDVGQGGVGPRVTSQQQFDALPKGATYIGEDGNTYRKP